MSEKIITLQPVVGSATEMIQAAVDECFACGGGTVVLENGVYHVGSVRVRSNVTVYLKKNVLILGSRNIADYDILRKDKIEPLLPEDITYTMWSSPRRDRDCSFLKKAGSYWTIAIFRVVRAKNVKIIGEPGCVIDGQNSYNPNGEGKCRGAHGISMYNSSDMEFDGLTIRNTGNWAFASYFCQNMTFRNLRIFGGYDGVHTSAADNVLVENCEMDVGDDCIAGFDINGMTVRNCSLDTHCSTFRVGGTNILIENCTTKAYGKFVHPYRRSLEDKIAGVTTENYGELRHPLSFFTYYSDFSLDVRNRPGNVVVRNCQFDSTSRMFHFNFSGNEMWQSNRPLEDITFENVTATNIGMSLSAYGDKEYPFTLTIKDSTITFAEPQPEFIQAAYTTLVDLENVKIEGVDGPLMRSWGGECEFRLKNVEGITENVVEADQPFNRRAI